MSGRRLSARLYSVAAHPKGPRAHPSNGNSEGMTMRMRVLTAAAWLLLKSASALAADDCHVGAYRFADGTVIDVAPSAGDTLRWRNFDGPTGALHPAPGGGWTRTFGWTDRPDGIAVAFSDCAKGEIRFAGRTGQRIGFE